MSIVIMDLGAKPVVAKPKAGQPLRTPNWIKTGSLWKRTVRGENNHLFIEGRETKQTIIQVGYKIYRANRLAWITLNGRIPDWRQYVLSNICGNSFCINPQHWELVTRKQKVRMLNSPCGKNARRTHCVHGHELTQKLKRRVCMTCDRAKYKKANEKRKLIKAVNL